MRGDERDGEMGEMGKIGQIGETGFCQSDSILTEYIKPWPAQHQDALGRRSACFYGIARAYAVAMTWIAAVSEVSFRTPPPGPSRSGNIRRFNNLKVGGVGGQSIWRHGERCILILNLMHCNQWRYIPFFVLFVRRS